MSQHLATELVYLSIQVANTHTHTVHAYFAHVCCFCLLTPICALGMLITDGDEWRRQRKILNVPFTAHNVKRMHTSIWEECQILFDTCERYAARNSEMDIEAQFQGWAFDVIGKV